MHGLFLYKDIQAIRSNNLYRLEILRQDYSGSSIEIYSMDSTPFTISIEGTGDEQYRPIIKSNLNISIKDTDQLDYTQFFTANAFQFKVLLKKNGTVIWSGYITPDSYNQSLQYRTSINLIARDNWGLLDSLDYDYFEQEFVSLNQLLARGLELIQADFTIDNRVGIISESAGVNVCDGVINTLAFEEKTWFEVLESVISSFGCQLRYVDDNQYALIDVAELIGIGDTVSSLTFVERSKSLEFIPAWRTVKLEQDYQKINNFFDRMPLGSDLTFVQNIQTPDIYGDTSFLQNVSLYRVSNEKKWSHQDVSGNGVLLGRASDYNVTSDLLLISAVNRDSAESAYIYTSFPVKKAGKQLKITFKAWNCLFSKGSRRSESDPTNITPLRLRDYEYQLTFKCNVFLRDTEGNLFVNEGTAWTLFSSNPDFRIKLFPSKSNRYVVENGNLQWNPTQEDLTINLDGIPGDGELLLAIYQYDCDNDFGTALSKGYFMRVDNVEMTFSENQTTGAESNVLINQNNNVKENLLFAFGEIPDDLGGSLAFAGGVYLDDEIKTPLHSFYRSSFPDLKYNLLELVGRGIVHHFRAPNKRITGTLLFDEIDLSNTLRIDDEVYVINGGGWNVVHEQFDGEFVRVEPYTTSEYTESGSVLTDGGSTIGGGGNTTLLWTHSSGNQKRISELETSLDPKNAFVAVDDPTKEKTEKFPVGELFAMNDWFYFDEEKQSIVAKFNFLSIGGVASYYDNGEVPSIFDHLPIASTTSRGIASFNDTHFTVVDGHVSLKGGGGGSGGYLSSVTGSGNGQMVFKQTNYDDITFNSVHEHAQYLNINTSRTANTVLAAPNGYSGVPTFRSLVFADLPPISYSNIYGAPTDLSYFTNSAGYLKSITKAMVEAVLTGNISSHYHSYVPSDLSIKGMVKVWTSADMTFAYMKENDTTANVSQMELGVVYGYNVRRPILYLNHDSAQFLYPVTMNSTLTVSGNILSYGRISSYQ